MDKPSQWVGMGAAWGDASMDGVTPDPRPSTRRLGATHVEFLMIRTTAWMALLTLTACEFLETPPE